MEPGRKLDALVAEKVMGLVVRKIKIVGGGVRSNVDDVGTVDPPREMPDGRMGVHAAALPAYSTEIAAAWEVLEKLQEGGMSVGLIDDDNGHWALASTGWQDAPCGEEPIDMASTFIVEKDEWADTAPLAICLAGLKAMAGNDDHRQT